MHHYHYYSNGDYHCSLLYLDIAAPIPKTRPGNVQIQSKSNGISAQKIKIPDISDDGENIKSEEHAHLRMLKIRAQFCLTGG